MQIWFVSERRRDLKYFLWCEFPRIFLFVSLRRRELKYFQARETGAVLRFVSLLRRELKYSFYPTDALDVMFVSGRRRELKFLAKAAPWTAAPVRLPKETRVEILWHITPDNKNPFVSARRRELKSKMTVEEEACIMIRLLAET